MDCLIELPNSLWLGIMSDITSLSEIDIEKGVTDVSSLFHSTLKILVRRTERVCNEARQSVNIRPIR